MKKTMQVCLQSIDGAIDLASYALEADPEMDETIAELERIDRRLTLLQKCSELLLAMAKTGWVAGDAADWAPDHRAMWDQYAQMLSRLRSREPAEPVIAVETPKRTIRGHRFAREAGNPRAACRCGLTVIIHPEAPAGCMDGQIQAIVEGSGPDACPHEEREEAS